MCLPIDNKMKQLYINIGQLLQVRDHTQALKGKEMNTLPLIKEAYLLIEKGVITDFGLMKDLQKPEKIDKIIDLEGKLMMPTWVDSHTHLVFAAARADEFVDKIKGMSYEEIAKKGGGILNSALKMQSIGEKELYHNAELLLKEAIRYGTGAIEIKSGYGLNEDAELKILRVIKKLKENFPIPIKATFLGAHALPLEYKDNKKAYIKLLIEKILPQIKEEKLADYIDVFCEKNYFSAEETEQILKAGIKYGLKPKIHANQFSSIGCVEKAVKLGAVSVDHLEVMNQSDYEALQQSDTIATLLPACSFFIDIPYAPAKEMIKKNIAISLATDFNPGSTPTFNMNFIVSLGCIKQKLSPEQAINAATLNAAAALELGNIMGSIAKTKKAYLMILKPYIKDYKEIPYYFGTNPVESVIIS